MSWQTGETIFHFKTKKWYIHGQVGAKRSRNMNKQRSQVLVGMRGVGGGGL